MSAAARKWLSTVPVKGASVRMILGVLADAADKNGRCNLSQAVIAHRAGVAEITVRRTLASIEEAGLIRREHRSAGGKKGRIVDLIHLNISWVQPIKMIVAPTPSAQAKKTNKNNASRARARIYTSQEKAQTLPSGRVWFEKRRATWRARVRLDGVDLDLGRFPTETEAAHALEGALADIEHAGTHRSGSPRSPRPTRKDMDIDTIGAEWPDTFPRGYRDQYEIREPTLVASSGGRPESRPADAGNSPRPVEPEPSMPSLSEPRDIRAREEDDPLTGNSYLAAKEGW